MDLNKLRVNRLSRVEGGREGEGGERFSEDDIFFRPFISKERERERVFISKIGHVWDTASAAVIWAAK